MGVFQDELAGSPTLTGWAAELKRLPDAVYRTCLEFDLEHEVRLSKRRFSGFLGHLAREWATSTDLRGAWQSASDAWKLRGPVGPDLPMIRLFRWDRLATRLEQEAGMPSGTGDTLLTQLLASQDRSALGTQRLGWKDHPVWGGFDPARPDVHPATGRSRSELMDLLGLPYDPADPSTGYPRTVRVVALRFEVSPAHVPTIADAGWNNPWWIPAPAKGAHGRARDVSGLAPSDLASAPRRAGLAERVTRNESLSTAARLDPKTSRFIQEVP